MVAVSNASNVASATARSHKSEVVENSSHFILDGCFHRYPNATGLRYQLKLYKHQFVFQAKGKTTIVSMEDVIGCHVMKLGGNSNRSGSSEDSAFFCIYAYHLSLRKGMKGSDGLARQKHVYVFEIDVGGSYESNLRVARRWQSAFLWTLRDHKFSIDPKTGDVIIPDALPAQRRYLCLVNPKSGPGHSLDIFLERVRPVLSEADISYLLLVTERCNHAREFVRSLELDQWSGIIIVSGDGLLHEVYNGLMERPDGDQAIKIPVGLIPGGSGNGLARSICHASGEPYLVDPILACTLGCVKGRVVPLDLCRIEMPKKMPIYSFLSYGWGIMSDIDIESEKLRFIGEIRFTLWAFWRIFNLRTYSGRVSYLPYKEAPPSPIRTVKQSSVPKGEMGPVHKNEESLPNGCPPPPPPPPPPTFTFGSELHERLTALGPQRRSSSGVTQSDQAGQERNEEPRELRESLLAELSLDSAESLERVADEGVDRFKYTENHEPTEGNRGTEQSNKASDRSKSSDVNGNSTKATASAGSEENIYLEPRDAFPTLEDEIPSHWKVEEGRFVIIYTSLVSHLGTKLHFAPDASLSDGLCWLMMIKGDATRRQIASYFINQEVGKHIDLPWVKLFPVKAFRVESFDDSIMTIDGEKVQTNIVQARVLPSKARILTF